MYLIVKCYLSVRHGVCVFGSVSPGVFFVFVLFFVVVVFLVQFKTPALTFTFSQSLVYPPEQLSAVCMITHVLSEEVKVSFKLFKSLQVISLFCAKECEVGCEDGRGEKC